RTRPRLRSLRDRQGTCRSPSARALDRPPQSPWRPLTLRQGFDGLHYFTAAPPSQPLPHSAVFPAAPKRRSGLTEAMHASCVVELTLGMSTRRETGPAPRL